MEHENIFSPEPPHILEMCPNFVNSFENLGDSWEKINKYGSHSRALFQKTLMRLSIMIHMYQLSLVIEMFDYDFNLSVRAKWNMK